MTQPLVEGPWSMEGAAGLRVPGDVAERFRERGWWRDTSVLHDLLRVAAERPDDPAIVVYSAQDGRSTTVRYAELAFHVRRFTAALTSLGVRRGDRVAFQLPNWWEVAALTLACCWTGAIAVPLLPTLRALELERILRAARAQVCVVVDTWEGYDCVAALEEISARLPWLRHAVVHGERVPPWAVDFREHFLRTPHEERTAPPRLPSGAALDRVCMLLFTSGTTGERKAVLHTENTLYAGTGAGASTVERGWAVREVFSTPHPITGPAGLLYCVWGPILAGGTGAYQDVWAPERYLELLSAASVTQTFLAPSFVQQLLEEQRRRPRSLPSLRFVMTGAAPVRADLARAIHDELKVPVRACWGMTEAGMGFRTREDDPCDWAAKSDGSPMPGLEMRLLPGPDDDGVHRLLVRGASVAVGFWRPGSGEPFHETWRRDDGWLDTGDLVREDGRGGIRFAGRASRRVGATFMIPVTEVEQEILRHPGVREVVLVGYEDEPGHESSCAVVVADGDRCPTLAELVGILVERGMTPWYLPTRLLEVSPELPRNENGKIRYERLKAMIVDSAGQLAGDRDERRP
ncbi:AMP-binding protein [Streptomyces sp. Amel2xC10]|uniref:AMP-binding protein n=1 Tax=Streptomyces sp. Amel2xC10 TaxID=1305826 RepID=UPI000A08F578|nr:AMP-binding protein [Streptomyces sp. Amel2xC10]SMF50697.1 cyclohexanecarboxylate-CoA ligase [Streptomyces sp. Amel2xC10]